MKLEYTERFIKSLEDAPPQIRKGFYKQVRFLLEDLRHPSLRAKKYDESRNIWQARVTRDWRFYFRIAGDTYYLIDIMSHPK
ncbi:MAG TPA: type II toxin-antitoxin system RelE/ParE family toxin [Blastocatellia bacterium]|nr:type II toxin-antitoxin system RelE/ParE family toxin [Blastocatellia bacterium]